jgi:hypothetical protein
MICNYLVLFAIVLCPSYSADVQAAETAGNSECRRPNIPGICVLALAMHICVTFVGRSKTLIL